jgi:hypothetical protein
LLNRAVVGGSVACLAIAVLLVLVLDGSGRQRRAHRTAQVAHTTPAAPGVVVPELPSDLDRLAAEIDRAQAIIDDTSSNNGELTSAGLFEQLATGALERETPQVRRATVAALESRAAATMRTNLAADAALSKLAAPHRSLPLWKIVQPPAPGTLRGYFRAAQSRFGVRWEFLAAIELIETTFGRVHGLSSEGARGPMQFMPATWARYGSGSVDNQRDAILSAARYLVANGAPGNMADALFHYNNSQAYVDAVEAYASRMRADPRAYVGYYYRQVLYTRSGRTFIVPVGYPKTRPVPVHYP